MNNLKNDQNYSSNFNLGSDDDEIDLGEVFATVVESKWLIVLITYSVLLLGIAKAFLDTPIYKADALLQVEEHAQTLGGLEPVSGLLETKVPVQTEIEILKSRMVLSEAVQKMNQEIIAKPLHYFSIGEMLARRFKKNRTDGGVSEPLFGKTKYAWGGEVIHVETLNVPHDWVGLPLTLVANTKGHYSLMKGKVKILEGEIGKLRTKKIGPAKKPIQIFVSLLKSRPGTHFLLVKRSLRDAIAELKGNLAVVEKGKGTGILALTYESDTPNLAMSLLNEIANIYIRKNVEEKSAEAEKTLNFLEKQLPLIKEQLEAATSTLNEYRMRKGSIDLSLETQSVLEGVVEVKTQLTILQQKKDELRQRFTEWHPSMVAMDKQIGRLESQMLAKEKKIQNLPETQQIILRLSRDVKVNTELYTTLLNNAQTLRVAKAGTVGDVRIIDYAVLPEIPIKPKKIMIVGISLILGLILGIAVAFIRKALHSGVKDPDILEKHLNIPVYATIPHSRAQKKLFENFNTKRKKNKSALSVLAFENNEDLAIESLRSLRTTIHFAFLEAKNNTIMIAGPSPGVGKSFVSVNLAAVLADTGKKVLLIDADLRNGHLHSTLGFMRENGLSEIIADALTVDKVLHSISEINIDFIGTGVLPPNPSELLLHERFAQFLEDIANQYDHIIIDSPPVLAVTDASIIGRFASATLLVVKAGEHPLRELEQAVKRFSQAGVNLKGIIFNDLPESPSKYGYGKYVYQYNYSKN